jgi:hypothetical protein
VISVGGRWDSLTELVATDRISQSPQDQVLWYYNDDPTCAESRSIPQDIPRLVLYVKRYAEPFILKLVEGDPNFTKVSVLHWVNASITEQTKKWSYRALAAGSLHNGYIIAWAPNLSALKRMDNSDLTE